MNDYHEAVSRVMQGRPPGNAALLNQLTVGMDFITEFWKEKYLAEYISAGGSKIKFITGNPGSGKTHFLELFSSIASDTGFVTVHFSAKDIWLHDFKEVYIEIFKKIDFMGCLEQCAQKIIAELGFADEDIPDEIKFVDYLSGVDLLDPMTKRELRLQLNNMFFSNPFIDNNFAICCSLLTGGILGHPTLEDHNRDLLISWLTGNKDATLAALRRLGLSPSRISKYNARHMLRSLAEVIKLSGYAGLLVTVDDMEIFANTNSLETIRYTKARREDAYESIRELVDAIDTLKHIMFLFAFDRKLIDDDTRGLKSYQALWMRIQNEVEGERFNRFSDIVDLDRLALQEYDNNTIVEMSKRLADVVNGLGNISRPIDAAYARELLEQTKHSRISLPRLVNIATIGGTHDD